MMDLKVFEPYFINNMTIKEYEEKSLSLSILDILKKFAKSTENKTSMRLFFKVNLKDNALI